MLINSKWGIAGFIAIALLGSSARGSTNIFACESEWGALAKEIAPKAHIFNAIKAKQDPHQIQARPSLISQLHKADLAICSGAELEAGWLPALQLKAANPKILTGKPGLLFAANVVETIDKIDNPSLIMGDVHPEGNPHIHLDPYRLLEVGQQLTQRLSLINASEKGYYNAQFDQFSQHWKKRIKQWEDKAEPLKGMKVIAYHSSFNYLFQWLGIEMVGDLEPKPGLPPSSKHLAALLELTKKTPVDAIVYTPYQDKRGAKWLGDKSGIPVVQLPFTVDEGSVNISSLEGLFNTLIDDLLSIKRNHAQR